MDTGFSTSTLFKFVVDDSLLEHGAALGIVETASLAAAYWMPGITCPCLLSPTKCDSQKCLQVLSDVSCETQSF